MSGKINHKGYWVPDNWEKRPASTAEDRLKYQKAWEEMMVTIWREKIRRLHVVDTHSLHNDITGNTFSSGTDVSTIQHKFLQYGIYQDCGTGRGYAKDNGGYLSFLDPQLRDKEYARKQKSGKITLGEPRKPREWFSRAYFASIMVMKEQMAYMYGEEFCGMLVDKIEEANHKRSTSMRSRLWGSRRR